MNKNVEKAAIALKVGDEKGWTAAEALWKANKEDGLSQIAISEALTESLGRGYSEATIRRYVKVWDGHRDPSARTEKSFTEAYFENRGDYDAREGIANREARKVVHERPEVIAEAIASAPREVQARFAEEIVKAPAVDPVVKKVVSPERSPRPARDLIREAHEAVMKLYDVSQKTLEAHPTGEEKVLLESSAANAEKIAIAWKGYLDNSLDDEFAGVLAEMAEEAGA